MGTGKLTIDLDSIVANWRSLEAMSAGETAAVVKADAYGLGVARVARALARAGARIFFVAVAEEGATLRDALGPTPEICVFSGHMAGDSDNASTLENTTAAAMVTASSPKMTPMLSVRNMMGVNTATSTAVVAMTANATCREPL